MITILDKLKTLMLVLLIFLPFNGIFAQNQVRFSISDGMDNVYLKEKMEIQISRLLSAINESHQNGRDINYSGIDIDNMASQSIGMLWNNSHFYVPKPEVNEICLQIKKSTGEVNGYQFRNIPLRMVPNDNNESIDTPDQEATINLDAKGRIVDFNISMGLHQFQTIMEKGEKLNDVDKRLQIIHYVEQFRTAYNQKDLNFMNQIFSDDALIITGKVVKRRNAETNLMTSKVTYSTQDKTQYLANLKRVFARNTFINVQFSDITVKRSGSNPNFYGVTVVQNWKTSTYSDEGIVFMLWDFTDPDSPLIHVRTWQPMQVDHVFNLHDFKLPNQK